MTMRALVSMGRTLKVKMLVPVAAGVVIEIGPVVAALSTVAMMVSSEGTVRRALDAAPKETPIIMPP